MEHMETITTVFESSDEIDDTLPKNFDEHNETPR